jgi:hypothetical protein
MAAFLINCENCGHCIDLSTPSPKDPPGLTLARTKIANQIKAWLAAADKEEAKKIQMQLQETLNQETFLS